MWVVCANGGDKMRQTKDWRRGWAFLRVKKKPKRQPVLSFQPARFDIKQPDGTDLRHWEIFIILNRSQNSSWLLVSTEAKMCFAVCSWLWSHNCTRSDYKSTWTCAEQTTCDGNPSETFTTGRENTNCEQNTELRLL